MVRLSRRRVLQVGGVGTALALAGCGALSADDEDDGTGGAVDESTTDGAEDEAVDDRDAPDDEMVADESSVTVVADIDEEAAIAIERELQEREGEILQRFDDGEIDEEEAEARMEEAELEAVEAEVELLGPAVDAIEEHVNDTGGLSVQDSDVEAGLVLVDGESAPIVGLLDVPGVYALLAGETFEVL